MKTILILFCGIILAGCAGPNAVDTDFHVKLIRKGPEKAMLEMWRQEPVVVEGPDGYSSHRKVTYWAALAGSGPTFVNPHFSDVPEEYHCIGSISLDLDHGLVSINMQRIVSKPGEPQETQPHPANGVHRIEKIRNEYHSWWF